MIRAIRPNAMAQDDAALISGWNIAPNLAYVLRLLPGSASCGVYLYDEDGLTLIASGAALAGTAQPCVLLPQTGQTVGMADAELGWHLLLTTTGTESQRTVRIGPAVDLPDEIHPVYGDDDLALARATAAIDAAAHYVDDITVTCQLGLGAGLGDVVSVPVDGVAVVGQVESITWTATPDGAPETAVIRRHVAIAPEAFVEVTPPTVADDTGASTHLAGTSGNVLTNDASGLTVVAVNGMASKVGAAVDGSNGGSFVINSDGSWTFSPDGDFALLEGTETADTSITYHASDGTSEAMATLTVTVSRANAAPVAATDTGATTADATTSGNVLSNDADVDSDPLSVSQVSGSAANIGVAVAGSSGGLFTIDSDGAWTFDPDGDFAALTGTQTATTSVTYHVSDGVAEDEGALTVTVSAAGAEPWTPAEITTAQWLDYGDDDTKTWGVGLSVLADKSGNGRNAVMATGTAQPVDNNGLLEFTASHYMEHSVPQSIPCHIFWVIDCSAMGAGARALIDRITTSAPYPPAIYAGSDNSYVPGVYWGSSWTGSGGIGAVNGGLLIFECVLTPQFVQFRINGGTLYGVVNSNSVLSAWKTISTDYSAQRLAHKMAERIIVNASVDATARQKIEGYLAHKWDALLGVTTLVNTLPSDHPYKSVPPTI